MEEVNLVEQDKNVMHEFSGPKSSEFFSMKVILLFVFLLILGIVTGNVLYNTRTATGLDDTLGDNGLISNSSYKTGQFFGSKDKEVFPDSAEGLLKEGGIDGEGAYHLERPGGISQNVYLTSTTLDLSGFLGSKIKVWGKTYESEKAGWLMDVGGLQIL